MNDIELLTQIAADLRAIRLATERGRGEEKPAQSNEKAPDISVTPEHTKRGRPATGAALTNAERQARHREKQAEPGPAQQLTLS